MEVRYGGFPGNTVSWDVGNQQWFGWYRLSCAQGPWEDESAPHDRCSQGYRYYDTLSTLRSNMALTVSFSWWGTGIGEWTAKGTAFGWRWWMWPFVVFIFGNGGDLSSALSLKLSMMYFWSTGTLDSAGEYGIRFGRGGGIRRSPSPKIRFGGCWGFTAITSLVGVDEAVGWNGGACWLSEYILSCCCRNFINVGSGFGNVDGSMKVSMQAAATRGLLLLVEPLCLATDTLTLNLLWTVLPHCWKICDQFYH